MSEILKQGPEGDLRNKSITVERSGGQIILHLNRLSWGPGIYKVDSLGTIGIGLERRADGRVQKVILDCRDCLELQGSRGRSVRMIDVDGGYGSQMIAPNKQLDVNTGYPRSKRERGGRRRERGDNRSLGGPWWRIRPMTTEEKYWV